MYDYEFDEDNPTQYTDDDVRLAQEMLRIAYDSHDGEEIYAARRYLREVKRGAKTYA